MVTEQLIWLIFLLPLISFFICSVIVRQLFNHHSIIAGYTAIILIGLSFLISVLAFYEVIINHNEITNTPIEWLTIGKFSLSIGLIRSIDYCDANCSNWRKFNGPNLLIRLHER